jgi:serine/threonine-protein kinase
MPETLPPGTTLDDRYTIEAQLGHGGMATVYRATDGETQEQVAVKVLRGELAQAIGAQRFAREIDIASTLDHPNVVSLIGSGSDGDVVYCVMPLFEGETLRDRLDREGQLSVDDALTIADAVAQALDFAHDKGIVHRDVKPENILLSGDRVGLADFGIARAVIQAEEGSKLTSTGIVVGTPSYMSPEQASADKVDRRSDIYALGCVLYEMLSGGQPFTAPTQQATLARHALDPVPDIRTIRPGLPDPVWLAVKQAMAKAPADRFKTADDFMAACHKEPSTRRPTRAILPWAITTVIAIGAAIGGWAALQPPPPPPLDLSVVAVLPFSLTAPDESDRWLTTGITLNIAQLLDGTGGLTAAPENRTEIALEALGKSREEELSSTEAREVAQRLGAGLYLTGNVVSDGTERIASVWLINTETGEELNRARESISELGVGSAIDRILAALLIDVAGQARQSETLLTQSQPALRAYVDGWIARREQRPEEAVQHFLRAVQEDTTFALAAMAWDEAQNWLPDGSSHRDQSTIEYMTNVVASNVDRLPRLDQAIAALRLEPRETRLAVLEMWQQLARLAPDRPSIWLRLGDHVFHEGPMLNLSDFKEQAAAAFDSALALGEFTPEAQRHLNELRFDAGDSIFIRQYVDAPTVNDTFDPLRWAGAWMLGDSAIINHYERAIDSLPGEAFQKMMRYSNYLGVGFPQADRAAQVLADRGEVPGINRAQVYLNLIYYQVNRGRPQVVEALYREVSEGRDALNSNLQHQYFPGLGSWSELVDVSEALEDHLTQFDGNIRVRGHCALGIRYALEGGANESLRHLEALRSVPDDGWGTSHARALGMACASVVAAALADSGTARSLLEEAAQVLDPSPNRVRVYITGLSLALASLFEAAGQPERALEFVTRRPFFVEESGYLTPALLMEGRLSLQVGDTARAITAYQKAIALLSDPEPSLEPIAREARETLAGLVAR